MRCGAVALLFAVWLAAVASCATSPPERTKEMPCKAGWILKSELTHKGLEYYCEKLPD